MNFNTPNIHGCIDQVIADPCGTGTMADEARHELSELLNHIKSLREQNQSLKQQLESANNSHLDF